MVKGSDLDNRSIGAAEAAIRRLKGSAAPEQDLAALTLALVTLKQRLNAAHALAPPGDVDNGQAWSKGRDAVLAFVEREG